MTDIDTGPKVDFDPTQAPGFQAPLSRGPNKAARSAGESSKSSFRDLGWSPFPFVASPSRPPRYFDGTVVPDELFHPTALDRTLTSSLTKRELARNPQLLPLVETLLKRFETILDNKPCLYSIQVNVRTDPEEPKWTRYALRVRMPGLSREERLKVWDELIGVHYEVMDHLTSEKFKDKGAAREARSLGFQVFVEMEMR